MKENRIKLRTITLRFLFPYMLVLFVPLVIGLITYYKTAAVMEKESVDGNIRILEQSKDTLDRRLQEIDSIVKQMVKKPSLYNYQSVSQPFEGVNTYQTMEATSELYDYRLSNNFIYDYYIYYKNSGLVLSANSTYRFASFYENLYSYAGMSADEWERMLSTQQFNSQYMPSKLMNVRNKPMDMVTYVQSMGVSKVPRGAIVVLINNEEIRKLLGSLDISNNGWAYIADKQGQMISHISPGDKPIVPISAQMKPEGVIERDGLMITYTTSDYNQWTYVVAQPTSIVFNKLNFIKKTTFVVTSISLLVGLLLAGYSAYRNSKPLGAIVKAVSERLDGITHHSKDAYSLIQHALSDLINNNDELTKKMRDQIPILRRTFFEQLLKGQFTSDREIERSLNQVGMRIEGNSYTVLMLYLRQIQHENPAFDLEHLVKARVLAKEALASLIDANSHIHDINEEQIALLLASGIGDKEQCRTFVKDTVDSILNLLPKQTNINVIITVGGIYHSITEISRSYEEAHIAMEHHMFHRHDTCIWYDGLSSRSSKYYYPTDIEVRLTNAVRAGEQAEAEKLLKQLYNVNFIERQLSIHVLRLFMYDMIVTIRKLTEHTNKEEGGAADYAVQMLSLMEANKDLNQVYPVMSEKFLFICREIEERKTSDSLIYKRNIIEYIHSSYGNPDVSLTSVAEHFNISEAYLSSLFKEQTGICFSDYLENVRMEKAKQLLRDSLLSINEISQQVGYHTTNTFGRAFKRIHGVNATTFKKSVLN